MTTATYNHVQSMGRRLAVCLLEMEFMAEYDLGKPSDVFNEAQLMLNQKVKPSNAGIFQAAGDALRSLRGHYEEDDPLKDRRIRGNAQLLADDDKGRTAIGNTPTDSAWGGYAETIIHDPKDYDALEIHGVREMMREAMGDRYNAEKHGTMCEVDDENPEFYSVYVHLAEGGVECIGDFETAEDARTYAITQIGPQYGWHVHDYTVNRPTAEPKVL